MEQRSLGVTAFVHVVIWIIRSVTWTCDWGKAHTSENKNGKKEKEGDLGN